MNRIKELIKEAGFSSTFERDRLHRLVELTVRECAQVAETAEPYKTEDLILHHFGIEREANR